jgi:hypothetical protein
METVVGILPMEVVVLTGSGVQAMLYLSSMILYGKH